MSYGYDPKKVGRTEFVLTPEVAEGLAARAGFAIERECESYRVDRSTGELFGFTRNSRRYLSIGWLSEGMLSEASAMMGQGSIGRRVHTKVVREEFTVPVVGLKTMAETGEPDRSFNYMALRELFPNITFFVVDLGEELPEHVLAPSITATTKPVFYRGNNPTYVARYGDRPHYLWYAWNPSSVKNGKGLALSIDPLKKMQMYRLVKDAPRSGNHLLQVAGYGMSHSSVMNVGVRKIGEQDVNGHILPFGDGCGYIKRSFVDNYLDRGVDFWDLGSGEVNPLLDAAHYFNEAHHEPVFRELMSKILRRFKDLKGGKVDMKSKVRMAWEEELAREVVELQRSNYFGQQTGEAAKKSLRWYATAHKFPGYSRVAIPFFGVEKCGVECRSIAMRMPHTNNTMIDVVCPGQWGNEAALRWAEDKEVIQYRLSSYDFFAKGISILMPDEVMGDYDIVVCDEDIKLASKMYGKLHGARNPASGMLSVQDVLLCAINRYKAGSAVAVNPDWWLENFHADFDGDLIQVIKALCNEFVKESYPAGDSGKLLGYDRTVEAVLDYRAEPDFVKKVSKNTKANEHPLWDKEGYRLRQTFFRQNVFPHIGSWTNVYRSLFVVGREKQEEIARYMGCESFRHLKADLCNNIQVAVDAAKVVLEDPDKFQSESAKMSRKVREMLGLFPRFWDKRGPNFSQFIPKVGRLEDHPEWDAEELKWYVLEDWTNVTARIAKMMLPKLDFNLANILTNEHPIFFAAWVDEPSHDYKLKAKELLHWFNKHSSSFQWMDKEHLSLRREVCAAKFYRMVEDYGLDVSLFSEAVWWIANKTRSSKVAGSVAWYCVPREEIVRIAREKPGINTESVKLKVVGVQFQLNILPDRFDVPDPVVRPYKDKDGARRYAVCGVAPSECKQHVPTNPIYPEDTIGVISKDCSAMEGIGKVAKFTRIKGGRSTSGNYEVVISGFTWE